MADDVFGVAGTTQAKHFRVEKAVAEGGFAVVYRAHHDIFRAPVALKCLKVPATLSEDQKKVFLEKFREEAELLFRLSAVIQPVVRPLQVGMLELPHRFVPFLALEWLEGESLDEMRTKRAERGEPPLGLHKLVKLLAPIAHALDQAHRLPGPSGPVVVVHCDIKPDNLFLSTTGGVQTMKILDFGIARVKSATSRMAGKMTSAAEITAFTPQYGAPEQWAPETYGQTGPWTDVYSLAISMVDMIAGRPPIDGSIAAMMYAVMNPNARPTPRSVGVTVADAVERCFERALAVEPAKRTPTVAEFWRELEGALHVRSSFVTIDPRKDGESEPPPPLDLPPLGASLSAAAPGSGEWVPPLELPSTAPRAKPAAPAVRVVDPVDLEAEQLSMALQLAPPSRRAPPPSRRESPPPSPAALHALQGAREATARPLMEKLSTPIKLAVLAMVIMIADQIYFRTTGAQFAVGPARAYWIAAPLVGLAAIVAFVRLMSSD
ncbi:MAG: serine/threonine-protein kinase [Polyangiaceae bacterium]